MGRNTHPSGTKSVVVALAAAALTVVLGCGKDTNSAQEADASTTTTASLTSSPSTATGVPTTTSPPATDAPTTVLATTLPEPTTSVAPTVPVAAPPSSAADDNQLNCGTVKSWYGSVEAHRSDNRRSCDDVRTTLHRYYWDDSLGEPQGSSGFLYFDDWECWSSGGSLDGTVGGCTDEISGFEIAMFDA